MKRRSRIKHSMLFVTVAMLSWLVISAFIGDDDPKHEEGHHGMGHSHDMAAMHGGQVTMTKEFHFEIAFDRGSVNVYVYNGSQEPISAKGLSGDVTISFRDSDKKPIKAELSYSEPAKMADEHGSGHGHDENHEAGQDFLESHLDLTEVQEGGAKAVFVLKNLPGDKEKEVTFKESFKLARLVTYTCPMKCTAPAGRPGDCPKCGMTLKRTETIYACPMHEKVTSRDAGDKCWVCGMELTIPEDTVETSDGGHGGHDH